MSKNSPEIKIPSVDSADDHFIVWAEATGHDKPIILTDLPPPRRFDDIVVPYPTNEFFFIDGASVTVKDVQRIKILRAKQPELAEALWMFHQELTRGATQNRKTYGDQFHVRC